MNCKTCQYQMRLASIYEKLIKRIKAEKIQDQYKLLKKDLAEDKGGGYE